MSVWLLLTICLLIITTTKSVLKLSKAKQAEGDHQRGPRNAVCKGWFFPNEDIRVEAAHTHICSEYVDTDLHINTHTNKLSSPTNTVSIYRNGFKLPSLLHKICMNTWLLTTKCNPNNIKLNKVCIDSLTAALSIGVRTTQGSKCSA